MTSRTAPRKRAAAGSATEPRHAPKSAPRDAGRESNSAISPGRPQRSRTRAPGVAAGRIEVIAWETPPDHDAVAAGTRHAERRAQNAQARSPGGGFEIGSRRAEPGRQVTPKNSPNIPWCARKTHYG